MTNHLLGYSNSELAQSPFARFYNPEIEALQPHVAGAGIVKGTELETVNLGE